MAAGATSLSVYLRENKLTFAKLIKELINQPENVSIVDEDLWSRLIKLTNSLTYWSKQMSSLMSKHRLILTTFNPKENSRFDNTTIFKALYNIMDVQNIAGIYYPQNTNYIGIDFIDNNSLELAKSKLQMVDGLYVVNLEWGLIPKRHSIRLHWLPFEVKFENINMFLKQYFCDFNITRMKVKFVDNIFLQSNIIEVQAVLKDGVIVDNVPYISTIDGHSMLVNIRGRPPICLECHRIGHIKSNCPFAYCKTCKATLEKQHLCKDFNQKSLFSDIVKLDNNENSKENMENQDTIVVNNNTSVESAQLQKDNFEAVNLQNINKSSRLLTYSIDRSQFKKKNENYYTVNQQLKGLHKIANSLDTNKLLNDDDHAMEININSAKRTHDQLEEEDDQSPKQVTAVLENSDMDINTDILSPNLLDTIVSFSDTDS